MDEFPEQPARASSDAPARREDRRDAVLEAVSYAAERFLRAADWQAAADDVMERLGRAAQVSRVYLFGNRVDDQGVLRACQLAEWSARGVAPQIESPDLEDPPYDEAGFGRWSEVLSRGDTVEGLVEEFPEDEQELLQAQGILSLVVMPVFVHDAWWGFFGLDECEERRRWTVAERAALRTATNILGAAVQRDLAEEALREREAHYRRLVEMSPYPIFALDTVGRVTELNRAGEELLGSSSVLVLGRPVTSLMADEDRPTARAVFERLMSAEAGTLDFETRIRTPAGEARLLHVAATAMSDEEGLVGLQGIARDITEERARDAQLRRAERLASLGTLIGGVAHELNNPLTSIRGLAELLLADPDTDRRKEMLETVVREADRTAGIVDDLRLLARRTQDRDGAGEAVDVNDVLEHLLKLRGYSLETHDVEVEVELDPELPRVKGDGGQLEQVLLNLLVNAEQALEEIEPPRRLRLASRCRADAEDPERTWVEVLLEDNGPGIEPGDLSRLFDPFWTTKDPAHGTGLGLSLAHKIVTEHGGRIEVESTPEAGARFAVILPALPSDDETGEAVPAVESEPSRESLASAASPSSPASPAAGSAGATGATGTADATVTRPLRLLVVDDERAIRRILQVALTQEGHLVETAEHGAEALAIARRETEPFDLVLSDLRMAGLSGEQLHQELQAYDLRYADRIVFMTGDVHALGDLGDGGPAGDGDVPLIRKPFRLAEVLALLEDLSRRPTPTRP